MKAEMNTNKSFFIFWWLFICSLEFFLQLIYRKKFLNWVSQLTRIDFQQISQFFRIFSAKYMVNYHNPTQVPSTIAFKKSEMF